MKKMNKDIPETCKDLFKNICDEIALVWDPNSEDESRRYRESCFVNKVAEYLSDRNAIILPDSGVEGKEYFHVHCFDNTDDIKINGSALVRNGEDSYQLHLFIAGTKGGYNGSVVSFSRDELLRLIAQLKNFFKLCKSRTFNPGKVFLRGSLTEKVALRIRNNLDKINAVRYWVLLPGMLEDGVPKADRRTEKNGERELTVEVVDLMSLADLFTGEISVDLDFLRHGPKFYKHDAGDYFCYLSALSGDMLAEMYSLYGTSLVESNVRAYLGKNKTNSLIRQTIAESPNNFLAYNNGLVIFAKKVEEEGDVFGKLLGMQIVNGGQTTASIYHAWLEGQRGRSKDSGRLADGVKIIQVPIKVIQMSPASGLEMTESEFQEKVAEAANSQSAIKGSDLVKNRQFHKDLHNIAKQLINGADTSKWFYECSRGLYNASLAKLSSTSEKNKFKAQFPKDKLVQKTDIAVSQLAWLDKPLIACKGKETAFAYYSEHHIEHRQESIEKDEVKALLAQWIIFKKLEEEAGKRRGIQVTNPRTPVIYSICLFSAKYFKKVDWNYIWQIQTFPSEEMKSGLLEVVRRVSSNMRHHMGDDMISMWARKPLCEAHIRTEVNISDIDFGFN